jgi:tetratricopeptide (TPR) repeat protein
MRRYGHTLQVKVIGQAVTTSYVSIMKLILIPAFLVAFIGAGEALARDGSLAVCADLSARAGEVVHHCRRALASGSLNDDQSFGAQVNLGEALLSLGQEGLAIEAFSAAAVIRPGRVEPYIGRADAYEALDRQADAKRDWDQALALAADSFDVRMGRGAFFLRRAAPDSALAEFDMAVRLDRDDPDAVFNRGLAFIAVGRLAEAEADFSSLLRDNPNDAGAYHHRGRARAGSDDRAAVADFDKAIGLAPEWADPWFQSGLILDRTGNTEAANKRFRRAFELGQKDPWLLSRISSLGG